MKKLFLIISVSLLGLTAKAQPIYLAQGAKASFFSTTPVEDIEAISQSMTSVLNSATGEIAFNIPLRTFQFKKALMQEHFNEKYVESDKYPNATFKGKVNETIDWVKEGSYDITATGIINLHGVDKQYTEKGKVTIKEGKISITSEFKVAVKDHNITIPKIVTTNIAEIIDVKLNAEYNSYKKEK